MADWLLADELPGTQGHNEPFDAHPPLLVPLSPRSDQADWNRYIMYEKRGLRWEAANCSKTDMLLC